MADLQKLVAAPGANDTEYFDARFPGRALHLYSARPCEYHVGTPILLVHHGVGRNGQAYRDYWLPLAEAMGLLAISVEFPEASFPEYLCYNFGNLHAKDGTSNSPESWTFGVDERLFAELRHQGVTARETYGLFGHSAGGQFVHRMLSFGYRDRVAVAISANAGTYAMPDLSIAWPWGLGDTAVNQASLVDWLGFPLIVLAGTQDVKTSGRHFPGGPKSMRQGEHRYARAHSYVRLGRAAADAMGTQCAWQVIDVPGVGHDGRRMSEAAAPILTESLT